MKKVMLLFSFVALANLAFSQVEAPIEEKKQKTMVAPPPPPPPPSPKQEREEIFKVVEEMPCFPGCEDKRDKLERKKCADEKMLEFVYGNLKYPKEARQAGIEGMVIVRFIVEKDGQITNAEVIRDIGGGCGQAALDVVSSMPNWIPGKQRGRAIRVQFNLPVRFKL